MATGPSFPMPLHLPNTWHIHMVPPRSTWCLHVAPPRVIWAENSGETRTMILRCGKLMPRLRAATQNRDLPRPHRLPRTPQHAPRLSDHLKGVRRQRIRGARSHVVPTTASLFIGLMRRTRALRSAGGQRTPVSGYRRRLRPPGRPRRGGPRLEAGVGPSRPQTRAALPWPGLRGLPTLR